MPPSDETLLVEQAKTDDNAFTKLYESYLPRIYGYIFKRVGNNADAEELTSQTFLKMVENLKAFKGEYFKSWLYRIATNTIIDYYRTHRTHEPIEEHVDLHDQTSGPAESTIQTQTKEEILAVLAMLPEKYQKVLHLKYFSDLSNSEMAASLEIKENNLGVLLHRALKSFQKFYNRGNPTH
ncbi:sigma-70 family RNA polymerase sigma factor [Candidatus Peregrinibacteria bacterium]|nr:sigma-70 family RNA polymerase sigma factor [Candidatus Peregrinibacteria bacterium]